MKLWLMEILACPVDHYYPLELRILKWQEILGNEEEDMSDSENSIENDESPNLSGNNQETPEKKVQNIDLIEFLIERYRKGWVFFEGGSDEERDWIYSYIGEKYDISKEDIIDELVEGPTPLEISEYEEGMILNDRGDSDENEMRSLFLYVRDDLAVKYSPFHKYLEYHLEKINEIKRDNRWLVVDESEWKGKVALDIIVNEIAPKLKHSLEQVRSLIDGAKNAAQNGKVDKIALIDKQKEIFDSIKTDLEFINYLKYHIEISDAVIFCPKCGRWYPVIDGIPSLLPDNLRDNELEKLFIDRWNLDLKTISPDMNS